MSPPVQALVDSLGVRGFRPRPVFAPGQLRHVLYLHGFRSSPQSFKARAFRDHLARCHPEVEWICPQLPISPQQAVGMLEDLTRRWSARGAAVLGSSLGGFYADLMARRRAWASVVLNPAVHPARDLAPYVGDLASWHDPSQRLCFTQEHVQELRELEAERAIAGAAGAQMAIVAKGDELLDWREMQTQHAGAQLWLLDGGDHALSDFVSARMPAVLAFLGLEMPATLPHLPDLECPR